MGGNIGKSIFVTFIISTGASVLSYFASPLSNQSVLLAIGVNIFICLGCFAAYVLLAKLWLTRQRSNLFDFLSVMIVPAILGSPKNSISSPTYGPTLTLYNGYLAPLENITRHFNISILNHQPLLILELFVPPLLMWGGLLLRSRSTKTLSRCSISNPS